MKTSARLAAYKNVLHLFASRSSSRNPRAIRIMSARRATSHERKRFEQKVTGKKPREPSRASLRQMPEVNFDKAKVRRNPYTLRIAREGISIHAGRGRPRKGTETGPTIPRSVRFPAKVWKHLESRARAEGIPLHAAVRAAVMAWLNS